MTGRRRGRSVAAMTTTIHRMQNEWLAAGLALVITTVALAFANFSGGDNGGVGPYVVCVGVCAILAAVLFGRVLPNAEDPARAGWILAAFALVTCLVFWTGLPFVLGMGAIYCGARAGRNAPIALGGLAIVLAFVGSVIA